MSWFGEVVFTFGSPGDPQCDGPRRQHVPLGAYPVIGRGSLPSTVALFRRQRLDLPHSAEAFHLLSKEVPSQFNICGNVIYGSWNTQLYDGATDTGNFGPGGRQNVVVDVHHMTSDGYQTYNDQESNAGELKYQFRTSDHTVLTGHSGVVILDSNTPNFNGPTRWQLTQYGDNFLLTNNSNPTYYSDQKYNFYHVPTDFEYVGLKSELGHGWLLDVKPYTYTYSYNNAQHYAKGLQGSGSPNLLFHDPRRTAARALRRAGVAEGVIMGIGGWKTCSIFERYAIVAQSDIIDAMGKFEQRRHVAGEEAKGSDFDHSSAVGAQKRVQSSKLDKTEDIN